MSRSPITIVTAFCLLATAPGCTDQTKVAEEKAVTHAERLAKLADEDVEEVRRGLPRGAKVLGAAWDGKKDPFVDPSVTRHALERAREGDRDLSRAKSTFFALTDDKGKVLRSDQEPDQLAGKSPLEAFPVLAKVLAGETIEARGSMPELAGAKAGGDEQWFAATPMRDSSGTLRGVYVSGWSMRRFAYHLEEALRSELHSEALRANEGRSKLPLLYVFVLAGPKVYGAPVTPLVNAEALEQLDLASKTASGTVYHQTIEITGRSFGLAAQRAPKMGPDIGVAVLRSET
jgi:hypothetical protein